MKNDIKRVLDEATSGVTMDERLRARVRARVAREGQAKRRAPLGVALAAALAVTLLAGVGALAAAVFSGTVDWRGNPVEAFAPDLEPTPGAGGAAQDSVPEDWSDEQPDSEYWYLDKDDGTGVLSPAVKDIGGYEEAVAYLRARGAALLVPGVPEGYRFDGCRVGFYFASADDLPALVSEARMYGRATLRRYALKEDGARVEEYEMNFVNDAGERLSVRAYLAENDDHEFGVYEGDQYETARVSGMNEAIFFRRPYGATLYAIRDIDARTSIDLLWALMSGGEEGAERRYHFASYNVCAYDEHTTSEQLVELMEAMK